MILGAILVVSAIYILTFANPFTPWRDLKKPPSPENGHESADQFEELDAFASPAENSLNKPSLYSSTLDRYINFWSPGSVHNRSPIISEE